MNVTSDRLIDVARQEVRRHIIDGDLLSAYLIGSVVHGEPLLGASGDVDLVLIHKRRPSLRREFKPISPDIHFDLVHHFRGLYAKPRRLRTHPWLGPAIAEARLLHDPLHFFEWAQAGVLGQFYRQDYILARARLLLERARQRSVRLLQSPCWLQDYLEAALEAANSVACLAGRPAAGRRLALMLERQCTALESAEIFSHFLALLGAEVLAAEDFTPVLSAWENAQRAAGVETNRAEVHPCRLTYYLAGFRALLDAGRPDALVWTLLFTWSQAMQALLEAGRGQSHAPEWEHLLERLCLAPRHLEERFRALEQFVAAAEQSIHAWAEYSGA